MNRTQIYIDSHQRIFLKKLASVQKRTISDLIREAISKMIQQYQKTDQNPFEKIVGLYRDPSDPKGSTRHDDLYE